MNTIVTFNKYLKSVEEFLLIVIVSGMTIILLANVFFRLMNSSISFAEEVGSYCMVATTYLGCGYAVRRNKHIKMTALMDMAPVRVAKKWAMLNDTISMIIYSFLGVLITQYMLRVKAMGSLSAALQIPRWIPIAPIAIGLFLTALQCTILVMMNIKDKENYWIGTERLFGEPDEELEENCNEEGVAK